MNTADVTDYERKLIEMIRVYNDELNMLRDENAALTLKLCNAEEYVKRAHRDRSEALSVHTREGLLASEWVARTGRAEAENDELRRENTRIRSALYKCHIFFDGIKIQDEIRLTENDCRKAVDEALDMNIPRMETIKNNE